MADHFYSVAAEGQVAERKSANIVVGTSSTGANPIELRITDGAITRTHVAEFLEWLSGLVVTGENPIVAGTLKV